MSDHRLDAILLEVARKRRRLTYAQVKALELLGYLSRTLELVKQAESTCEHAPAWICVEIDGRRHVDVGDDGNMELEKSR